MIRQLLAVVLVAAFSFTVSAAETRPNIVFIGAEDISPDLGCYGNTFVQTPNIDKLAAEGARFDRCYTHGPVCAVSRSGMITGMYPMGFGTQHHRSKLKVPPPPTFTSRLRKGGYYVAYPGKTDFNFDVPADAFDSTKNWMKQGIRSLPQPFFAYINFTTTHESKIRASAQEYAELTSKLTPDQRVDPAKVTLPPYWPDTPEVRRDVANEFELITAMDYQVGEVLAEIEKAGLAENTIVVFWGDHGWGLPRGKRWVYESGTRCPLVIKWPGKVKPGTVREDLVAVVDFAPTFLTMAGVPVAKELQGEAMFTADGGASPEPRKYVYSERDRMDETTDRIRAVRDARFRYIKNFMPQLPYAQRVQYGEMMPTMKAWRRMNAEGKLNPTQALFFAPTKPEAELYDLDADPFEVHNLAGRPEHAAKEKELCAALDAWIEKTGDMGAVPEEQLVERGVLEPRKPEKE